MAIGAIWIAPIDEQTYDAVAEKALQPALDRGLRFHAAGPADDAWRVIEIWDSREALEGVKQEVLHPAFDEVTGGDAPKPEPDVIFEVYNQAP
jgi:hypothetical protein